MYVLRAVSVPGLTPVQRVEVTAQGAVVFRRAGLGRKYSLLLYMAGLMSAEGGNVQVGWPHYLYCSLCCISYIIDLVLAECPSEVSHSLPRILAVRAAHSKDLHCYNAIPDRANSDAKIRVSVRDIDTYKRIFFRATRK